jgi:melatonin receptor type 1B
VITNTELHTATNILVFNLAIADLVISGFVDSFTIFGKYFSKPLLFFLFHSFFLNKGVLIGKNYFDLKPELCKLIAAICLIACETSLINIGFLAINR